MIGDIIKIKARHSFTLFPRGKTLGGEEEEYGIVKWIVSDPLECGNEIPIFSEITVTGMYAAPIDKDKEYTILAKEIEHEVYGKQYQLIFFGEIKDLSNLTNQRAFLSTILTEDQIKHIYEVTDNPIKTIEQHDVETLKKAWGIGDYIANCIIERFDANRDNCAVYIELDGLGLTPNFIQKLISYYKNPQKIINVVKNKPYQLATDIEGIGFKKADEIALKNGLDMFSYERVAAYIVYYLNEEVQNGNSYVMSATLTSAIFTAFGGKEDILKVYTEEDGYSTPNNVAEAIKALCDKDIIRVEDNGSKAHRRVYLTKYYKIEKKIAEHLKRIKEGKNTFEFDDWENKIAVQENLQGWKLTEEQYEGVKMCLNEQVVFITGGAGSGKTSVLSCALNALNCLGSYEERKYSFAQCSLSGKAAARMSEVTGENGYTIHRLLGYNGAEFSYNEKLPLDYDIIIVDEISLVGGEIFLSLLEAIKTGTKLIVLGDMGQLESIGIMNLAHDLYCSDYIPTIKLTKIHRQAQKSGIIVASQKVRDGEELCKGNMDSLSIIGELQDMTLDISKDKDKIRSKALEYYKKIYESDMASSVMDVQILAAVKERGDACVFNLNQDIQEYLNPHVEFGRKEIKIEVSKDKCFYLREEDKVMCIKNDYNVLNEAGIKTPVMNGWTGILKSIDTVNNIALIYFDIIKQNVIFTTTQLRNSIVLGYACTVHKYQGSSAKNIICVLDYTVPPMMRTKELVYTMLTRAEKNCVLIAQGSALNEAIKQSGIIDKNTFLPEMLDSYC